jgi:uncharacterized membrane protein YfcA
MSWGLSVYGIPQPILVFGFVFLFVGFPLFLASNFEDDVMVLIERKRAKKASNKKDIKLSWIFFILGSAFGIISTLLLSKLRESIGGIPLEKVSILFMIVFSFLVTTQLDSIIDFYRIKKMRAKSISENSK